MRSRTSNIPAAIEHARAGALAGKEGVVTAEAYAAAVPEAKQSFAPLRSPLWRAATAFRVANRHSAQPLLHRCYSLQKESVVCLDP